MKRDFYVQGSEDGEPNWQPRLTSTADNCGLHDMVQTAML